MNKVKTDQEFWYWYFVFFNDFAEAELKKMFLIIEKKTQMEWKKRTYPVGSKGRVHKDTKTRFNNSLTYTMSAMTFNQHNEVV